MAGRPLHATEAWHLIRQLARSDMIGPYPADSPDGAALTLLGDGSWHLHRDPADAVVADLLACFLPLCHPALAPLVYAQVGQSLDGRIATVTGASHYINGCDGLDHLHRLRAIADVVVVGAGTADSDNPQLTVRRVDGDNPDRAIIDPRRRVSPDQVVFDQSAAPTFRLVHDAPCRADEIQVTCESATVTPADIIRCLQARGYRRIFIEGGGQTVSRFLHAGCLDHLHLIVAPMIIGSGIPALQLPEIDELDGALRPETVPFRLGSDYLFDMRFRPPPA
ncbi:RibD family protein [Marinobacter halodurans]|uniref:RibD family protein n=1 Tax=Marinobacter halodurans TaxID=2528979 RepID=A0ABY1ZGR4_9GAMM|nr:RibD family protein [Marinobacter halodurans]TBW51553.1 RibD family protein [Marinobacter halodurans]